MSKDLTEKYINGELPDGSYYARYLGIVGDFYICKEQTEENKKLHLHLYEEILAPVPTYEEYLALESDSLAKKEAEERIAELEAKMKIAVTTLSRISDMVYYSTNCDNFAGVANDALVKLGENK